jgi:membrane associated rhomboid family serine protease
VLAGDTEDRWTEIRHFRQQADAEQHALVLIAMSINCLLVRRPWGIGLLVALPDAERAEYQLQEYDAENLPRLPQTPPFALSQVVDGALIFAAILILIQAAADAALFGVDWGLAGDANANLIAGGEWWRTITSLSLHGNLGHLMSNLVFGAFFGIVLCQILGAGLGWLSILATGALGNLMSAWAHYDFDVGFEAIHSAIGASTAVFGALGLLAALTWLRQSFAQRGLRRYAPLAAGVMLLAFLGIGGERTDIGGHLGGFAAGIMLAFFLHYFDERIRKDLTAQLRYGAAAIAIFATAWIFALTSA